MTSLENVTPQGQFAIQETKLTTKQSMFETKIMKLEDNDKVEVPMLLEWR